MKKILFLLTVIVIFVSSCCCYNPPVKCNSKNQVLRGDCYKNLNYNYKKCYQHQSNCCPPCNCDPSTNRFPHQCNHNRCSVYCLPDNYNVQKK